jgi:arylsulfatase
MLSHLDVLPLCLEISGAKPMPGRILDGGNPLPALMGTGKSPHARLAFAYSNGTALREGSLKIVRHSAAKPWELYDLATDRAESNDLAASRPADVARLAAAFNAWRIEVERDASPPAPRPARPKK